MALACALIVELHLTKQYKYVIMYCMDNKHSITFRLTPEAIELIKQWAKKLGVSQAAIMEMAIREFSEKRDAK